MSTPKLKEKKKKTNVGEQIPVESAPVEIAHKAKKVKKNASKGETQEVAAVVTNEAKTKQKARKPDLTEEVPAEIQPKKKKNKGADTTDKPANEKENNKKERSTSTGQDIAEEVQISEKPDKKKKRPTLLKKKEGEEGAKKKNAQGRIFDKSKGKKGKQDKERGVIYIGHLPYGFVEEGLRGYFEQYGDITHLRLARSKRTARSKGYAFIEFKFKEVADIAAKAMNGYIINGKTIKCHVLEKDKANPFSFRYGAKKFKYIPWKSIFIKEKNKEKSDDKLRKHVNKLLKKEEEKRKKLADLGIDYEFPGYKAIVDEAEN